MFVMSSLRKCTVCGKEAHTEEDLELFRQSKQSKHGRENRCKECHSNNNKKYPPTKEQHKRWRVSSKYGISLEEYETIMQTATHCEICGSEDNLCYDHDHNTMKFRGVLCSSCNLGLGKLGDSLEGIESALKYLRKHYVSIDE